MHPSSIACIALWLVAACSDDCTYLDSRAGSLCGAHFMESESLRVDELPTVAATLGDRTFTLLLDTGAEATVISSTLLGRPDQSRYRLQVPLCLAENFCLENTLVYAWDTPLSGADPAGIQGILGMDVLRRFTLKIVRNKRLALFLDTAPCEGAAVPLAYTDAGTPTVSARLDQTPPSELLVDTGAAVCLLSDTTVATLESYFREGAVSTEGCTVNGCRTFELSRISRLCVGENCVESVETKFPAWNALGGSFFAPFTLELDFGRNEMRFCEE